MCICLFVCLQTTNKSVVAALTLDFAESKEADINTYQFVVIKDSQQNHCWHSIYTSMVNKNSVINNLKLLLRHLTFFKVGLESILPQIIHFLVFHANRKEKLGKQAYVDLTMWIHDHIKKTCSFLMNSDFVQFIPFWLKSCFANDCTKNPTLDINFDKCKIKWTDIPVSSHEVITWYDNIIALLDHLAVFKYSCCLWYKYWILRGFEIEAYIQILDYVCIHVQSVVTKSQSS